MIGFRAVWAITLRHLLLLKRDLNLLLGALYWPILDILVWGFLGAWIAKSQTTAFHNYETVSLMGILLWQVVGRGCNIMIVSFAEELWQNNIVNLFSLPLRTTEWICGIMLFYVIMLVMTTFCCMLTMFILYDLSVRFVLFTFFIFLPPLILSAIWLGFTCLQIVVILGKRGTELGFVLGWFLLPFSGAYYPIEILPKWGQIISAYLPMSYVFQAMRAYVMYQQDPTANLIKAYVLGTIYATVAVMLFVYRFNRSKQIKGLARLAD